jgi:hypothetical protein
LIIRTDTPDTPGSNRRRCPDDLAARRREQSDQLRRVAAQRRGTHERAEHQLIRAAAEAAGELTEEAR